MKNSESILINITYEDERNTGEIILKKLTRNIEVIANNQMVFTEKQTIRHPNYKTRSGIAGAVNLLEDLIAGKTDARFLNDEHKLWQELQSRQNGVTNGAKACKHAGFFAKMRFKFFYFKMKLLNVLFK